ncbi:MAG: DinB family protein, partial [Bryobacterales bacterium]|nr:DinB family protein [Bryobacterales bacterium]
RSVSEVLMHVAVGNYWLLAQAGAKIPGNTPPIAPDLEKKTTKKDDVLRWLGNSFAAVRAAYPQADKAKAVKFAGRASTAEAVFLRLLVHNHEHMGQMIAYTRSMGIKPPWSKD